MKKLLLLHGAIGAKTQFDPITAALQKDFEVFSINFPGHGGEAIPDTMSIQSLAHSVLEWMEAKQIEAIDIFGYSMGGYVALYLARHHPGKVKKIFTMATKFDWSPEIAAKEAKLLNPAKIQEKIPRFAQALAARHAPQDWEKVLHKTVELLTALGENKALKDADFQAIEHSVLVSVGDRDNMVSFDETKAVYSQLKNGSLLILPDTHHPFEKANPERMAFEIKHFFKA